MLILGLSSCSSQNESKNYEKGFLLLEAKRAELNVWPNRKNAELTLCFVSPNVAKIDPSVLSKVDKWTVEQFTRSCVAHAEKKKNPLFQAGFVYFEEGKPKDIRKTTLTLSSPIYDCTNCSLKFKVALTGSDQLSSLKVQDVYLYVPNHLISGGK
jgi:hypothetical protein